MAERGVQAVVHELAAPESSQLVTAARFKELVDVPPELEWFANISSKSTRRAYDNALQDFIRFIGISQPGEFREVPRSQVSAWRDALASRGLSSQTIRHRSAALSSLFEHLCDSNAVTQNPVKGVKHPWVESTEGNTPALGDHQAASSSMRRTASQSRASAIGRSWPPCSITRCGATSCAG